MSTTEIAEIVRRETIDRERELRELDQRRQHELDNEIEELEDFDEMTGPLVRGA